MTTPFTCPECGDKLELHDDAETEVTTYHPNRGGMPYIEKTLRPAVIAACVGCEFAIEVRA